MAYPFLTIGHSTRPIGEFIGLLRNVEVRLVVDVRTVPRSRANPQYHGDALQISLSEFQITYEHIAALGGLRGRQRDLPKTVECVLAKPELSQLRGLRLNRDLSPRAKQTMRIGSCFPVLDYVRGSAMVAVP